MKNGKNKIDFQVSNDFILVKSKLDQNIIDRLKKTRSKVQLVKDLVKNTSSYMISGNQNKCVGILKTA